MHNSFSNNGAYNLYVFYQQMELLQDFYETTLEALKDAKNDRLWFKTNTKLGKLYYDRADFNKLAKILKQLHQSCQVSLQNHYLLKSERPIWIILKLNSFYLILLNFPFLFYLCVVYKLYELVAYLYWWWIFGMPGLPKAVAGTNI